MNKIVLWSVRFFLLFALVLFIDTYYFHGTYLGHHIGLGSPSERDLYSLDQANSLAQTGETEVAKAMYQEIVNSTQDDIVFERALRAYGNNLEQTGEIQEAIRQDVALASNPRVRARARAGALENLAQAYLLDTGLTAEELNNLIFTQAPFNEMLASAEEGVPEYVVLLEHANTVSLRPLVTAMLAEYYGKQVYAGKTDAVTSLKDMFAMLPGLVTEISETNTKRPLVYSYQASALLYASATGHEIEGYSPVTVFEEALLVSKSIYNFSRDAIDSNPNTVISVEKLSTQEFAPAVQFSVVLETLQQIPYAPAGINILREYDWYEEKGYDMPVSVVELASKLKEKYSEREEQNKLMEQESE